MKADLLFHNGAILTMTASPQPEALAVADGRILALGSKSDFENLIDSSTKVIDLAGSALLPGFNDAHVHVWKVGHLRTTMLDLREQTTLEGIYAAVHERAAQLEPGTWLLGRGWNEAKLEGGAPVKSGLDIAAPNNPVVLTRTCAHIHTANSSALALSSITSETVAPAGGELDYSRGHAIETAYGLLQRAMPAPMVADYERYILAGLEHLRFLGVTSATDPAVDPVLLEAYRSLEAQNKLPIRVNVLFIRRPDGGSETYPLPEKFNSGFLRVDSVKFFADGGLSGATAAVSIPFRNTEQTSYGVLRFETEELYQLALEAHLAGFRIGTHAIGDRALDQILEVYSRLEREHPNGLRHRIEHFGLANQTHLAQAQKLGVFVVPQAIFLHELRTNFQKYVPTEFLEHCYNLRAMIDAGLTMALSTDGPVVRELDPLEGIKAAMLEPMVEGNGITLLESLQAYTLNGAIAQSDESNRGTLEVGKHADLVVISNPFTTKPEHWKLEKTFVAGLEITSPKSSKTDVL
jgi:predicted amidohydrolase YtcJ